MSDCGLLFGPALNLGKSDDVVPETGPFPDLSITKEFIPTWPVGLHRGTTLQTTKTSGHFTSPPLPNCISKISEDMKPDKATK